LGSPGRNSPSRTGWRKVVDDPLPPPLGRQAASHVIHLPDESSVKNSPIRAKSRYERVEESPHHVLGSDILTS